MNRLSKETSPYLRQHAHNPVDWYAWRPEAFAQAQREDKPILVSIGYSTCHWCHVMERESFENEDVAAFMNAHFINIKVDREERPDVDQIYMEACQIMTGAGGWPLNVFLTPDKKPFYAGTYFPPRPAHQRPSWIQVLQQLLTVYRDKREVVEQQADRLLGYISRSDDTFLSDIKLEGAAEDFFLPELLDDIFKNLEGQFDKINGGFGGAPKFPAVMSLSFLLQYFLYRDKKEALTHVSFSLDKMMMGGIYDQLGGGFARYTTDSAWLVPHFEKMLYDNALLVGLYADAYRCTGDEAYRVTIEETLSFIEREMTDPKGGFYAALDADSEGEEGKFYVWSKAEIENVLAANEADLFCRFYQVTEEGNWEGHNILWRPMSIEQFSKEHGIEENELKERLTTAVDKLLKVRSLRIRPGLDDKLILSWNALQVSAYAKAAIALDDQDYKKKAIFHLEFLLTNFCQEDEAVGMYHTYKDGKGQYAAMLDDYAYLIRACLDTHRLTFDTQWIDKAKYYTELVRKEFKDEKGGLYFYTSSEQEDLVIRRKDLYDNATPSGNSVMLGNFLELSILLERPDLRQDALDLLLPMKESIIRYPSTFGQWAQGLSMAIHPLKEIAVVGPQAISLASTINRLALPPIVIMASETENDQFPLLKGKQISKDTYIYVCSNYSCQRPVKTIEAMMQLI